MSKAKLWNIKKIMKTNILYVAKIIRFYTPSDMQIFDVF